MADLDDFFAKKDRKKSKGKSKFSTADEIAKKLEETGKKNEKIKKEKPLPSNTGQGDGEESGILLQEDEWKDFEEEKKDYTGLKIQNITLTEVEPEDGIEGIHGDDDGGMEENEAGELVPRRKISTGPWKCVSQPQIQVGDDVPQVVEDVEKRPVVEEEKTPARGTGSSTYIPPFARSNAVHTASNPSPRVVKNRAAPDVHSEDAFPTLSASKTIEVVGAWKKKRDENIGFEEVRNSKSHSSRHVDTTARMTPGKLTLGNKFGALTNDQS